MTLFWVLPLFQSIAGRTHENGRRTDVPGENQTEQNHARIKPSAIEAVRSRLSAEFHVWAIRSQPKPQGLSLPPEPVYRSGALPKAFATRTRRRSHHFEWGE